MLPEKFLLALLAGDVLQLKGVRDLQGGVSEPQARREPPHDEDGDGEEEEGDGDVHVEVGGLGVQVGQSGVTKVKDRALLVTLEFVTIPNLFMRNLHLEVEWQNKADAQQGGDADEDEQMLLEPEKRIDNYFNHFNEQQPEILDSIRTSQLINLLIRQYNRLAQPLPESFLFYIFSNWPQWQVQSPPDPREALNFAASAIWVIVQARFPSRQHPLEVTLLLLHPFLLEEALHLPQLLPLHLAEALPQLLPLHPLLRLQERVLCRIVQTPPGLGSRCPSRRQVDLGFGVWSDDTGKLTSHLCL